MIWSALRFVASAVAFRPDLMISGVEGPFGLAGLVAARLIGAKYVFIGHTGLALPTISKTFRWANGILCRQADRLVAHGPFIKQEMVDLGVKPQQVLEFDIGVGDEPLRILADLPSRQPGHAGPILFLGRVEQSKGVFDLLNAFGEAFRGTARRLQFAGTGAAEDSLRAEVARLGLQDQVEVLGRVPFKDLYPMLRAASVFVAPTRTSFAEGRCASVMEALYAGTPVIAPDYGPFPYLVKHEHNGFLYEVDSVGSLKAALERFFGDTALADRLAAGARTSGEALMYPEITFPMAIESVVATVHGDQAPPHGGTSICPPGKPPVSAR